MKSHGLIAILYLKFVQIQLFPVIFYVKPSFGLNPMEITIFPYMFPFLLVKSHGEIPLYFFPCFHGEIPRVPQFAEANFLIAPRPQKDGQPWVAVYVPQSSTLHGGDGHRKEMLGESYWVCLKMLGESSQ